MSAINAESEQSAAENGETEIGAFPDQIEFINSGD